MTDRIKPIDIEQKMRNAYLEYAMSVIIGRALPDVCDGLKPVHRRVLYAMSTLNLGHSRPFMKSARIVGEVMGKFHPHGDVPIYDSLVRMVQPFSLRYPLINGQGNFGSIDGDTAAAMRYTEVRFQKLTQELLADLEKDTVDFTPNYDGSLKEPCVLPTKIPNLLINGSTGIAVGMATNIPPHNLTEIINGLLYLLEEKENASLEGLMQHIPGPDLPTAGTILKPSGIKQAYTTGKGSFQIRSVSHIEQIKNREAIVVTELPYSVNKARLIEKIADLVRDKKITGIHDLRDESDRDGIRVVIEIKKGDPADVVEANLRKLTSLQVSFGITLLAVINNQPKVMSLITILRHFINHRINIVQRRVRFDLNRAEARAHILRGLQLALDNIDSVIELVKAAPSVDQAKTELIQKFELSLQQATAILEMRLQRLTQLEQNKLVTELKEIETKIAYYKEVLADEQKVLDIIGEELAEIKATYGDERRTSINYEEDELSIESLIADKNMLVLLSRNGYIKRFDVAQYAVQHRGGRGKMGTTMKEEDAVGLMFVASTHDTLLMFSNLGRVYWKKVYELPEMSRQSRGRALVNLLPLEKNETIQTCLPVKDFDQDSYVLMVTEQGTVKKTALKAYKSRRSIGSKAILIEPGDQLVTAKLCQAEDSAFIATKNGMGLRFPCSQARAQGKVTRGSRGIKLREFDNKPDQVVSLDIFKDKGYVLTVTEKGFGKQSRVESYREGTRGNQGVLNIRITARNGCVVNSFLLKQPCEMLLTTQKGKIIRIDSKQVSKISRATQGVKLIQLEEDEFVVSLAPVIELDDK